MAKVVIYKIYSAGSMEAGDVYRYVGQGARFNPRHPGQLGNELNFE